MTSPEAPPVTSAAILAFHDASLSAWRGDGMGLRSPEATALWEALADNHRSNILLWEEEDLARRRRVPDTEIAANKRAIDRFNQTRNDAVERMDEVLAALVPGAPEARLHSETPGAIIDRLSIASLKLFHMNLQVLRRDVDDDHRTRCAGGLACLREQRADLAGCLDALLADCRLGRARFRTYRQFKMYNDPRLNLALVREGTLGGETQP